MKKGPYYWIRKSGKFGKAVSFGDPIPADTPENRIAELEAAGYISETKPATGTDSSEQAMKKMSEANKVLTSKNSELDQKVKNLEISNQTLKSECQELKDKLKGLENSEDENAELKSQIEELQAELEDVPKNVREANSKIKKLEKEIAELTEPKKGK